MRRLTALGLHPPTCSGLWSGGKPPTPWLPNGANPRKNMSLDRCQGGDIARPFNLRNSSSLSLSRAPRLSLSSPVSDDGHSQHAYRGARRGHHIRRPLQGGTGGKSVHIARPVLYARNSKLRLCSADPVPPPGRDVRPCDRDVLDGGRRLLPGRLQAFGERYGAGSPLPSFWSSWLVNLTRAIFDRFPHTPVQHSGVPRRTLGTVCQNYRGTTDPVGW